MSISAGPDYGFGLYVHWPYCTRICPYCDFNVYAAKDRDIAPLVEAICNDIVRHKEQLPGHPALDSVFLGGGTPSLLTPHQIDQILETAADTFGLKTGAEITIEANPNDVLRSELAAWKSAGVNRVSIGLQSLRDEALDFLGRDHDAAAALQAVEAVQTHFDNHSIDLIYARPDQSLEDWSSELRDTLALGAPHLSLYELTIEARTAFGKRAARGELVPMEDEAQADLYELTNSLCTEAGLPAYEVSNHASAQAYQSVHNQIYWASGDWIGVGPGAHGRVTRDGERFATEAAKRPEDYVKVARPEETQLTQLSIAYELIAMGLRPANGFDLKRLTPLTGVPFPLESLCDLQSLGLIEVEGWYVRLTPDGRLLADRIATEIAAFLPD